MTAADDLEAAGAVIRAQRAEIAAYKAEVNQYIDAALTCRADLAALRAALAAARDGRAVALMVAIGALILAGALALAPVGHVSHHTTGRCDSGRENAP